LSPSLLQEKNDKVFNVRGTNPMTIQIQKVDAIPTIFQLILD